MFINAHLEQALYDAPVEVVAAPTPSIRPTSKRDTTAVLVSPSFESASSVGKRLRSSDSAAKDAAVPVSPSQAVLSLLPSVS